VVRQLAKSRMRHCVDEAFIEVSPDWVSAEEIDPIFSLLTEIGLKEVWRSSRSGQFDVYLKRPPAYKLVENERARLGCRDQ